MGMTILLESGDIGRFNRVGQSASYCRCVKSERTRNGKKKGEGNAKSGNKYLSWAYVEAANFMVRYNEMARKWHQRKASKTNQIVATKALANKIAKACYFIIRDEKEFDVKLTVEVGGDKGTYEVVKAVKVVKNTDDYVAIMSIKPETKSCTGLISSS